MGFKLPGKSVHSGTSSHRSALKMAAKQKAASALKQVNERETSWWKGEEGWIPDELQGGDKATVITGDDGSGKTEKTIKNENREEHLQNIETETKAKEKSNLAYGGDRTWEQAQKESKESGGDLNQTTRDQKAYEKEMRAKHGKDWNKREDNQWKKRQNIINAAVGSKKVYEVDSEVEKIKDEQIVADEKIVKKHEDKPTMNELTNEEGETVYGGALDADKELNKNELKYTKKLQRQKVKDARKEFGRGSDEVKSAKATKKEEIKKTKKMVKTGKKDRKFVDRDEKLDIRIKNRKDKGKSTTRLENKKAKNKQKEKEFGESLG